MMEAPRLLDGVVRGFSAGRVIYTHAVRSTRSNYMRVIALVMFPVGLERGKRVE